MYVSSAPVLAHVGGPLSLFDVCVRTRWGGVARGEGGEGGCSTIFPQNTASVCVRGAGGRGGTQIRVNLRLAGRR